MAALNTRACKYSSAKTSFLNQDSILNLDILFPHSTMRGPSGPSRLGSWTTWVAHQGRAAWVPPAFSKAGQGTKARSCFLEEALKPVQRIEGPSLNLSTVKAWMSNVFLLLSTMSPPKPGDFSSNAPILPRPQTQPLEKP